MLGQCERRPCVVRDKGGGSVAERGGDGVLATLLHVEQRQREPFALLRQRTRGGR